MNRNSLKGCAIGCGVIGLLAVVGVTLFVFYVINKVESFEQYNPSVDEVKLVFGRKELHTPVKGGIISQEELNTYFAIRDSLERDRINISLKLENIDRASRSDESELNRAYTIFADGLPLITDILKYRDKQNKLFLSKAYSPYQYYYVYVLTNFSYLGNSPGDGPQFQMENGNIQISDDEDVQKFGENVLLERDMINRRYINHLFVSYLQNIEGTGEKTEKEFSEELVKIRTEKSRLPFENNMPLFLSETFDSNKVAILSAYDSLFNAIELELFFETF